MNTAEQIPGIDAQAIEAQRQAVREKYAAMQLRIDASKTIDEIKTVLTSV